MLSNTAFTLSLADIFFFGLLAFFVFFGFKRGALRTLYSILRLYFSFIITIVLYEKLALVLQASTGMSSAAACILSFTAIFIVLVTTTWVISSLVRRKIAKGPETNNGLSKLGGGMLGILESLLLISIIIMDVNFYSAGKEAESPLEHTASYNIIKRIAPSIEYFTVGPIARLKQISEVEETEEEEVIY